MSSSTPKTPLSRLVTNPDARASPLAVLREARRRWLRGQRINLNEIAEAVGISRTTLFRWVGTKELLMAEVMWSVYQPTLEQARRSAPGEGPDYIADVCRRTMTAVMESEPLRLFLQDDPQFALQVLTATRLLQERRLNAMGELLREQFEGGHISPSLELESLALVIIRMTEAFSYSDLIVGRQPPVDEACKAIRILCGAPASAR